MHSYARSKPPLYTVELAVCRRRCRRRRRLYVRRCATNSFFTFTLHTLQAVLCRTELRMCACMHTQIHALIVAVYVAVATCIIQVNLCF